MKKIIFTFISLFTAFLAFSQVQVFSQKDFYINSLPFDNTCMEVRTIQGSLDTMQGKWVGIYHAEITNDCLQLGVLYGGCKPEMEFVTDNTVIESQSFKLSFLLKYMNHDPCKDTLKTTLKFDLLPFKNMKPGKSITVSIKGTPLNLNYLQRP